MFETLYGAISAFSEDYKVKELYFDDETNKIVTSKPDKGIKLVEKTGQTTIVASELLEKIVERNISKYKDKILEKAKIDALSYDELTHLLLYEFNIFYDAANEIKNRIFDCPQNFGLRKIFHYSKTLAFSPV
ncbi:MAG: hypothetical protein R2685_10655 [Candidatus Nitrosocosmicus sp.]|nr:hypothetical protein [Candidatus Nitrosocosmicus sp.]